MELFIQVAKELREINNFHYLTAIISAFNQAPLLRLKYTKEKLTKRSVQVCQRRGETGRRNRQRGNEDTKSVEGKKRGRERWGVVQTSRMSDVE